MLNVISLQDALDIVQNRMPAAVPPTERLPLGDSCGRILSEDVISDENVPAFDRSTMDGYAVIASDTFGAGAALPAMLKLRGEIVMGADTDITLFPGECVYVPTGGMLPAGANAVVPVEYTEPAGDLCLCCVPVSPRQNVTKAGDDVSTGQAVLRAGTVLSPAAVGVLAAMGVTEVPVFRRPKAGVISTGNELVDIGRSPLPGQVRDVNSALLGALCGSYGCRYTSYGIIPDIKNDFAAAVLAAAKENDVVLLSGGSSAGKADLTAEIVSEFGKLYCHGIAVKPGKPTVLGAIGNTPVFGLPGHPAACWFMTELLVRRYISRLLCKTERAHTVKARLAEHVSSNHGREELIPVRLENGSAVPVYAKSGVISQLSAAEGYIIVQRESEGLQKDETVEVYLF